jgi:hypothetical protein
MTHSCTSKILTALLCVQITTPIAYAASVRLRARDEPALVDEGLTAAVTAGLAGLAHDDVLVTLKATGVPTARCPAERRELTFVTHQLIEAATIVDGAVPFTIRTDPPVAGVPECPNAELVDIEFTDAFLEVRQPPEANTPLLKAYCNRGGCVPIGS